MKATVPNWQTLEKASDAWTDVMFPRTDIIRWSDYPSPIQNLSFLESQVEWKRLSEVYPSNKLYGSTGAKPDDTQQGALGDCYFISAAAAIAEDPNRIKKVF